MYVLDPADYERTVRQLTFSPTVNINPVPVNIINDDIHEDSETFLGTLSATGQPVILNPDTAVVTNTDDIDRKVPCCYANGHIGMCLFSLRQQSRLDLSELSMMYPREIGLKCVLS